MLTKSFPWPGGDDFLLSEIDAWKGQGLHIVIAPERQTEEAPHPIPGVEVDTTRIRRGNFTRRLGSFLSAAVSRDLWTEMRSVNRSSLLSARVWVNCVKTAVRYQATLKSLRQIARRRGHFDLVYSYWKDAEAYAAVTARAEGKVSTVVTRAHGYDLYPHRHPGGHVPFTRRFARHFDLVALVSEEGRREFLRQGGDPTTCVVARLGVNIPAHPAEAITPSNSLKVVSISHCVPVKRLELLVEALDFASLLDPSLQISWTHVGGGPQRALTEHHAARALSGRANVDWQFTGHLPATEVDQLLRSSGFDLMVNVSASEGVPVSLMEAMSYGIPALALDVGGVAELVDSSCGWLLPADSSPRAIARALVDAVADDRMAELRQGARDQVATKFSAAENHQEFVDYCLDLIKAAG